LVCAIASGEHLVTQGRELNSIHKKTGIMDAGFLFDDERAA
jgi:hypothetical protein